MSILAKCKKELKLNDFTRNVFTLMSGTTVAQIVPIAISPILTRMYSPNDFGALGLFSSIILILGPIANAKYEQAIVLPEEEEEAINVTALSIFTAFVLSFFLFIFIIVFNGYIVKLMGNQEVAVWLYFIPLVVFFTGAFNAFSQYNVRLKKYKNIASATVNKSLSLAITQLVLGFFKAGATGLILGQIVSNFTGNTTLVLNTIRDRKSVKNINKKRMANLAKRYIDFPKYYMWAILANSLSYNVVNFFISSFFSVASVGFYTLGNRVLGMPTSLIGSSIGQVFFKEAVDEKKTTGCAEKTFKSTLKKLLLVGIPFFGLTFFLVEYVFVIVFGSDWRMAGVFARILTPVFFVRFVLSPLTYLFNVFEKQKIALAWQIGLLLITVFVFIFANIFDFDIKTLLYVFSTCITGYYIMLFLILNKISKGKV